MSVKDPSFIVRFRSSCILMGVTVFAFVLGGPVLFFLVLTISLIGQMELYRVYHMNKSILAIAGYCSTGVFYYLIYHDLQNYIFPAMIALVLLLMIFFVLYFPKFNTNQVAIAFFGVFYVSVMLSFLYQVRIVTGGAYLVWLAFIGAWGSDTCAYLVGRKFGKHKLAPVLSPKKSIEGSIGGILGAALLGVLFAALFQHKVPTVAYPYLVYALIGGCTSIISQIGDLAASAIKRNHEVKDYGTLIPGHGGVLDRFDSIIFTAPIVYYLIHLFMK